MAKPVLHRFKPSTPELARINTEYELTRALKKRAADLSQWGAHTIYDRKMTELKVDLLIAVRSRLLQLGKLAPHKSHLLNIRYVTSLFDPPYWVWFTSPVYPHWVPLARQPREERLE